MTFSLSTAVELTKRLYPNGLVESLIKTMPALGIATKATDFYGEGKYIVHNNGDLGGQSATFANAQTNIGSSAFDRFLVTRSREYSVARIDTEFMRATSKDVGGIRKGFEVAMDKAMEAPRRSLGIHIFGNGGGARGRIASTGSGNFVLTTLTDAKNFVRGMKISCNTNDGTGSGTARSGVGTVTGVNYVTGTITYSGTITGISANDYVFRDGDFGAVIKGLAGWIPAAAIAGGDSWFGVDRSVDQLHLAGQYYAPTSGSIKEILVTAGSMALNVDGRPDLAFMNPVDFGELCKDAGAINHVTVGASLPNEQKTTIGYSGIQIATGAGMVEIVADPYCPRSKVWLGKRDTLHVDSLGELIGILNEDGNQSLRSASTDGIEIRLGGYMQMYIAEPKHWVNVTLPS